MPRPEEAPHRLDLLVAGHVNLDHFLRVERMPTMDRTVPLTGRSTSLGGTAGTIARSAARAEVRVGLVGRLGEDFPSEFLETFRREGVDTSGLEIVPGELSPACYIFEDGRGHQMTAIHQGPMGDARGAKVPESLLDDAGWLHLTTGPPHYQLRLKAAARRRGLRVAVDPAQEIHYLWSREPLEKLLDGAEIVFGNRSEISRIKTMLGLTSDAALLERVPLVVRTESADGVTALSRTGKVHIPAIRLRRGGRVTGAGDAFRGGFYGAFFRGEPLADTLKAGVRASASWMHRVE